MNSSFLWFVLQCLFNVALNLNFLPHDWQINKANKKSNSQTTIREFRQKVVKAADVRRLKSQPRVSLERKEYVDEVKKLINSDHWTGVKLRQNYKENNCPVCGLKSKNLISLQAHIRYHKYKKELKAECPHCKKRFATITILQGHIKSHIRAKPFKCPFCSIPVAYRSTLIRRLKKQHGNEREIEKELKRKWNDSSKDLIEAKMNSDNIGETEEDNIEESEMDQDEDEASSMDSFTEDMSTNENDKANNEILQTETEETLQDTCIKVEIYPSSIENTVNEPTLNERMIIGLKKNTNFKDRICCEFCKKSFSGLTQLSKHINDDKCPENGTGNDKFHSENITELIENGTVVLKYEATSII